MQVRKVTSTSLLLAALALASLGCRMSSERLIRGTYRAASPCVVITLTLNRDHSFLQTAKTSSGEVKQVRGKWLIRHWKTDHRTVETVDFDTLLDFHENWHGDVGGNGETGFQPELWPRGIMMGPLIVKCPESSYQINYVK